MRKLLALGFLTSLTVLSAVVVMPAGAKPHGTNGLIAFTRFNAALGDTQLYTVNPDGSSEHQVLADPYQCPRWSPDGTRIAGCGTPDFGATRIVNPDDGTYRDLPWPDPELFSGCGTWSPDGKRLACESFGTTDPTRNGIYTMRSSDGGYLKRVTSNPGGDDLTGDYSPDGKRFVFARSDAAGNPVGLFVVNVNGTGLKQITTGLVSYGGDWSSKGNEIVFAQHATPDARNSIWVVHANGSGLHEVAVQAQPACGGVFSDPTSQGCFEPRWSPDGRKIVFARGTSGDFDSNIYTVNADGSDVVQVTHGQSGEAPDWGIHPLTG